MNKNVPTINRVSLSNNRYTIHATGKHADMIAGSAAVMLLLVGVAALIKALS
jgi:hypothetical protein